MEEVKQELKVDEHTIAQLTEISRWTRFLGGAGIFFGVLFVLMGMIAGEVVSKMGGAAGLPANMSPAYISGMFFLLGLVFISVSYFLLRFGRRMRVALNFNRQDYFNHAFYSLKLFLRILGILVIAYFAWSIIGGILFNSPVK